MLYRNYLSIKASEVGRKVVAKAFGAATPIVLIPTAVADVASLSILDQEKIERAYRKEFGLSEDTVVGIWDEAYLQTMKEGDYA